MYKCSSRSAIGSGSEPSRFKTHSLDFAGIEELDHGLPGLSNTGSLGVNDDLLALAVLASCSRRHRLAGSEVSGPVDEVEVEVVGVELLKGVVEVGLDELGAVRVAPEFGDEEELLAVDGGATDSLGDLCSYALASEVECEPKYPSPRFGCHTAGEKRDQRKNKSTWGSRAHDHGGVDVAVASLDGSLNSILNLSRGTLPSSQADLG